MNCKEAMKIRKSNRTYIKTSIAKEKAERLAAVIQEANRESGLRLTLVLDNKEAFDGIKKSYGMFSGVTNYVALVGKKDSDERYVGNETEKANTKEMIGYYGEKVVLEATTLGLGTCWVGLTYDKSSCPVSLESDEEIFGVITVGNTKEALSIKEKMIRKIVRPNIKSPKEMSITDETTPDWFFEGMEGAVLAPSAKNKQPVTFIWKSGNEEQGTNGTATAKVESTESYELMDMGIAKLHFEIGAGSGKWQWGNGGEFARLHVY